MISITAIVVKAAPSHHNLFFTADWDRNFAQVFGRDPVVPDPATRSPSVSATASRLRRARNEVCVTVIVRTVLTHEG